MPVQFAAPVPFSLGYPVAISETVGYGYHVALDGHPYLIDLQEGMRYRSVPLLRPQADDSSLPGEASLNPEDAWRRSVTSWHLGAGQINADRDPTGRLLSPSRFRSSKGIDIWTDDQISLLSGTDKKRNSVNTNVKLLPVGSRLYVMDGASVAYTTDPTSDTPTFTDTTDEPGGTLQDITSDGYHIWITDGSDIYQAATDNDSFSAWSTQDADVLAYVKGRLMFAHDNTIGYCTDFATPTFATLFTHDNTSFTWVGFAEGRNAIYAAGQSGDKALVYRIPIKPDGSALDVPIVALELPDGETITGIGGYLGFVFLGTSEGVRFCEADTQGNLVAGAPFGAANCRCFEGQGRFVWFGWTAYDDTSTGLGRFSPVRFADPDARVPVHASDLMTAGQNAVTSVVTFGGRRYFAVSGDGFYGETTSLVSEGTIDSGLYGFGVGETKIALSLTVRFADGFVGTLQALLSADGGAFELVGSVDTAGTTTVTFPLNEKRGEQFEVRLVLKPSGANGPTVIGWGLRTQPALGSMARIHIVPLVFASTLTLESGYQASFDVQAELNHIVTLHETRDVVVFQRGPQAHSVIVDDFEFAQNRFVDGCPEGTLTVALKEL